AVPCRRGAGNGCRGTPAPPPVPHEALLLPTAPHSTPLFPTVNIENTSHLAKCRAKSQVRGGGAEWGPPRPRPRAPVRARAAPGPRPDIGRRGAGAGERRSRRPGRRWGKVAAACARNPITVEDNGFGVDMDIAEGVATTYCRLGGRERATHRVRAGPVPPGRGVPGGASGSTARPDG